MYYGCADKGRESKGQRARSEKKRAERRVVRKERIAQKPELPKRRNGADQ